MSTRKYVDETTLNNTVSSIKNEAVLLTEQNLTDEQKAQVKANLGISDNPVTPCCWLFASFRC